MRNFVYNYFAENFGTVHQKKSLADELDKIKKYANYFTKEELKRELKTLTFKM